MANSRLRIESTGSIKCVAIAVVVAAIVSIQAMAQVGGAGMSGGTAGTADRSRQTTGGRVFIDVVDRPLGAVLDYLSRVGEYSIVVIDDEIRDLKITLRIENVYWRDALDIIAQKYNLEVNESKVRARVFIIERPKLVEMKFENQDIKYVITTIAVQAGANVVIGQSVKGTVTLHLRNVPWRDAIEIVARAANCVVVPERRDVIRLALPSELEAQMETRIFQLAYIQPQGNQYIAQITSDVAQRVQDDSRGGKGQLSLQEVLEKVNSEKGTVAPLQGSSSLIVTDTPQKLEVMERIINQLDRPPKQVHLSLKLIELSDTDAEEVGLLWQNGLTAEASGMSFSSMFPFSPSGSTDSMSGTFPGDQGVMVPSGGSPTTIGSDSWVADSATGGLSLGSMSFSRLQVLLKFLQTQTTSRVIQAPQLIALDHEAATIHVGELVRYAESFVSTTEGGGTASGFREAKNSPVKLGIQVLVIPHVTGPDNNVILTVIPKTESQARSELFQVFEGGALGQLKLPQTLQRTVVTKMMLRDRETGIIAGLRQQSFGETITKVPVLGDLPLIGWLFRFRNRPAETNKNSNLLILITPTVIDFEKKTDVEDMVKKAQGELGRGFSLEEEAVPQLVQPGEMIAPTIQP
jgi:type IV pilus assembly protein PilQ